MLNSNERDMILTYSNITGNSDLRSIYKLFKKSETFNEVHKGNKIVMYEGYTSNLLDVVNELRAKGFSSKELSMVDEKTVAIANRSRRNRTYHASKVSAQRKKRKDRIKSRRVSSVIMDRLF